MAIAVIGLVALMLAAEGALFLWLSDRTAGAMPARDPRQMAQLVAADLSATLEADPALDIEDYLHTQYGHFFQTFLVLMRDRRIAANHDDVGIDVLDAVRIASAERPYGPRSRRFSGRGDRDRFREDSPGGDLPRGDDRDGNALRGTAPDSDRSRDADPDGDRFRDRDADRFRDNDAGDRSFRPDGGRGRRRPDASLLVEFAPVFVNDDAVGRVAVLPGSASFSRILRVAGPTMAVAAGGVLMVGGLLIGLVVFGPARARLRQMQETTERLGAGDAAARAPETGGDEIAAVARSFNRMADELTNRARALEISDTARRQLLADVSHELMTPLTAMRGYIETLGMSELQIEPHTRDRYLRIVSEETTRLERIIGDLLDLARLEGGGITMQHERVPIDMLFNRTAERHERELSNRRVTLQRTVGSGAEYVTGDPDRLEQVLQNLVANALRYTPNEGRISLSAERAGGGIRITVRDNGPGIPHDQLSLVFDRFYKVDASRKAAGGSGLGLSIAKAIVERHGGTITARNDEGAVFDIELTA